MMSIASEIKRMFRKQERTTKMHAIIDSQGELCPASDSSPTMPCPRAPLSSASREALLFFDARPTLRLVRNERIMSAVPPKKDAPALMMTEATAATKIPGLTVGDAVGLTADVLLVASGVLMVLGFCHDLVLMGFHP